MLLAFVLEQGPHEVGARLAVLLSFSLCSVKVHSLILGNWVDFLFVCVVGFLLLGFVCGFWLFRVFFFKMLVYARYN